jgi:hypothetical protein
MAKFGLFEVGSSMNPREEYDGEYLFAKDDMVCVMANGGGGTGDKTYAVIRLAPGQSVKKIKE